MAEIRFDKEKISDYFHHGYSNADSSYIDEVFGDNSKEKELKLLLSEQFDGLSDENGKNLDHILYRIHYEINNRLTEQKTTSFDKILKWTYRIAGILVLPLLIFIGIRSFQDVRVKQQTWTEIKAPAWTRAQFSLPDGTIGWLNSNSSVRYNGNFNSDRTLTLKGEAFFDVVKDKKRPFKVNTNDVLLTVLGTRFNIASYDNEKNVEVVLEEGKLIFSNKATEKEYTMKPNDLIVYDKNLKDFSTEVVEPQKYLSWTEGKLVFRNDPLDVIARRLERWYNIKVDVNVTDTEGLRLRATFVDEGLDEVMEMLKRSLPVDYKIENGDLSPDKTYLKRKVTILPRTNSMSINQKKILK